MVARRKVAENDWSSTRSRHTRDPRPRGEAVRDISFGEGHIRAVREAVDQHNSYSCSILSRPAGKAQSEEADNVTPQKSSVDSSRKRLAGTSLRN